MSGNDEAKPSRRHTVTSDEPLATDPFRIAEIEARNGLRQFDIGRLAAQEALDRELSAGAQFKLRQSLIFGLHREALRGLSRAAGSFRAGNVSIQGSRHQPPPPHLVPELIEALCDYVNDQWSTVTPIHLGAYVMWRLNWIHPLEDGNGRTSRMTSYVVMTIKSGFILPGVPTIPDQIVSDRSRYFESLEKADAAYESGRVDVFAMEELLAKMLARQLAGFYQAVGGALPAGIDLDDL